MAITVDPVDAPVVRVFSAVPFEAGPPDLGAPASNTVVPMPAPVRFVAACKLLRHGVLSITNGYRRFSFKQTHTEFPNLTAV